MLTPTRRTLRARLAAHAKHARHDPYAAMAVAREGRDRRFREQAQAAATERGESTLSEHELERRARQLLKQHMTKLSFLASKKAEEARAS